MKNSTIILRRGLLAGVALGAFIVADAALAQSDNFEAVGTNRDDQLSGLPATKARKEEQGARESAASSPTQVNQVVVTGTRLRNLSESPSPLQTVTERDIELGGFGSVQDLVRSLPANQALANEETIGKTSTPGSRNETWGTVVNLRGVGPTGTLVLVNGRRMAPAGFADGVDVSMIPLAALSRVDVLTDTASAVYGTDAVSGVVNFILKKSYEGAETMLRYGTVTDGGENTYQVSQLLGSSWQGGGAMIAYEFRHQNPLKVRDRAFTPPGNFFDGANLTPKTTQHGILLSANQSIANNIEISGDLLWSKRDFGSVTASPTLDVRYTGDVSQIQAAGSAKYIGRTATVELGGTYTHSDNMSTSRFSSSPAPFPTRAKYNIWEGSVVISGEAPLAAFSQLSYAAGASYRRENFSRTTGAPISTTRSNDRSSSALFVEGSLPIRSEREHSILSSLDLLITAAIRYEKYSDFGSTTVYKVGALWKATEQLRIRASYGESFKAPNLLDLLVSPTPVALLVVADPASPTGQSNMFTFGGGNAALSPETATVFSTGFDYSPPYLSRLRLGGSYFKIRWDNKIQVPSTNTANVLINAAVFGEVIDRTPDFALLQSLVNGAPVFTNRLAPRGVEATQVVFDNRLRNLSAVMADGIDLYVNYSPEVPVGDLTLSLNGSYLFALEQRVTSAAPAVTLVDTTYNPADLKVRAGMVWTRGSWTLSGYANYTDNYSNRTVTPAEKVDANHTVDARAEYRFKPSGVGPVRVALAAQNIFDRAPPYLRIPNEGYGYDPANASARGRFVSIEVSTQW